MSLDRDTKLTVEMIPFSESKETKADELTVAINELSSKYRDLLWKTIAPVIRSEVESMFANWRKEYKDSVNPESGVEQFKSRFFELNQKNQRYELNINKLVNYVSAPANAGISIDFPYTSSVKPSTRTYPKLHKALNQFFHISALLNLLNQKDKSEKTRLAEFRLYYNTCQTELSELTSGYNLSMYFASGKKYILKEIESLVESLPIAPVKKLTLASPE